jgi:hypothetical protein
MSMYKALRVGIKLRTWVLKLTPGRKLVHLYICEYETSYLGTKTNTRAETCRYVSNRPSLLAHDLPLSTMS